MRIFRLWSILFLFTPVMTYSQTLQNIDTAVQNCAEYLQGRFPRGTRAALVAITSESPELGEFVHAKLNAVLVNSGWFIVVERSAAALESIAREMERHLNFEISEETELSVGRQLGAQIIISGSFSRSGQNWRLDIHALRVESAERAGQWSAEIRSDPAWASLASPRTASLAFAGDALGSRDMNTITTGLRNAMQSHQVMLNVDENPAASGYVFTVTIYLEQVHASAPANIDMLQAEIIVTFSRGGRMLSQSQPYRITETSEAMIARRLSERLGADGEFFSGVKAAIQ